MTHHTTLVQRCRITNSLLADEMEKEFKRLERERDGEREAREKSDHALRQKDSAMSIMFRRLDKAGIDYSDLMP